mgnify:FL=1
MDLSIVGFQHQTKVIFLMHFCKKSGLSLIVGTLIILAGCDTKREALGADNEIRVICSEIDKQIVRD